MADVTGALHHAFGGKAFALRLTWGVLADLQGRHGDDFLARLDVGEGKLPPFGLMIDIVAASLVKGEKLPDAEARDIADDMLTADPELVSRLLQSAFPDAGGNGGAAAKRRR